MRIAVIFTLIVSSVATAAPNNEWRWTFDTPSSLVRSDNGFNVPTTENPTIDPGWQGNALNTRGGGLRIPSSKLPAIGKGLTISLVFRLDEVPTHNGALNLISCENRFLLRIDPARAGGRISFFCLRDDRWEPRVSGPTIQVGRWVHVIAVATPDRLYLWVNGRETQSEHPGRPPEAPADDVVIGNALADPSHGKKFPGLIDNLFFAAHSVGRKWIYRAILQPAGSAANKATVTAREQEITQTNSRQWTGLWGADAIADATQARWSLNSNALIANGNLDVPLREGDHFVVRGSFSTGTFADVLLLGSKGVALTGFPIARDGKIHAHAVPLDRDRLGDRLLGAAFYVTDSDNSLFSLQRVVVGPAPPAPPRLRVTVFAPDRRYVAPKASVQLTARIHNDGGLPMNVGISLALPATVAITPTGRQSLRLPPGGDAECQWFLRPSRMGELRPTITIRAPSVAELQATTTIVVTEEPVRIPPGKLRPGYPRAMDFRHLGSNALETFQDQSVLLVDLIGDKIEAARAFKKRYPDCVVLMQINDEDNGLWGSWFTVPREFAAKEGLNCRPHIFPMPDFKGYWLLRPGAPLSVDFPAGLAEITMPVPDVKRFIHGSFGGRRKVSQDVLVIAKVDGKFDWLNAEFASIDVDADAGTLRVKRWPRDVVGAWHDFRAGKAVVAPSAGDVYGAKPVKRTWIPNLTKFCPRDPRNGLDAAEWWARHFARLWHEHIAVDNPHPDGMQFDWPPFYAHKANADCNLDGIADGGEIEGISYWGLGMHRFFHLLRAGSDGWTGIGEKPLLLADASNTLCQRSFSALNGSENEEFAGFGRPWDLAGQMDLYRVWCQYARTPRLSYLQSRFPSEIHHEGTFAEARKHRGFRTSSHIRMALAAACMEQGIHTYRTGDKQDRSVIAAGGGALRYDIDSYHAGRLYRFNWLGAPLEDAQCAPGAVRPEPIARWTFDSKEKIWSGKHDDTAVAIEPPRWAARDNGGGALRCTVTKLLGLRTPQKVAAFSSPWIEGPAAGEDLVVSFQIKADMVYNDLEGDLYAGIMRTVAVRIESERKLGAPASILVGEFWRDVSLSLSVPGDGQLRVTLEYGAELGNVELDNVEIRPGCALIMCRRFENGLVLMNGSYTQRHKFDVPRIDGRPLRRLPGLYCPGVNTGKPANETIEIAPLDALFLITQ